MTRTKSTIPFHNLVFSDDLPKPRDIEKRLTNFLKTTREKAQRAEIEAGRMTDDVSGDRGRLARVTCICPGRAALAAVSSAKNSAHWRVN
jgi:hypothetical protein